MSSLHLPKAFVVCAAFLFLATPPDVEAQAGPWDELLANSEWYVPAENLLAYITPTTNLSDPQAMADQTLWSITTVESGVFSGTSVNEFKLGPVITSGSSTMSGIVTPSGQVRIVFTDDSNNTTVGVGQMREVEGTPYVEMQMITGAGSAYVTHWAYMASYNGDPETLPVLDINASLGSEEWNWMKQTSWTLDSAEGLKTFEIADYQNGYFWGSGISLGSEESFTLIGSATPEGNILFAFVQDGVLTSLIGQITGDGSNGAMVLRGYDGVNVGEDAAYATVIPEPSTGLAILGGACLLLSLRRPRR